MDATPRTPRLKPLFRLPPFVLTLFAVSGAFARPGTTVPPKVEASDSAILRYVDAPLLTPASAATGGAPEWTASVDCASPVDPASLIGAQVRFAFDHDLDGSTDAADSLGISPADCGESKPGRIALRRRFRDSGSTIASVLRADLSTAKDSIVASHTGLMKGLGSLLKIVRYCARPQNGEPEWIEIRNVAAHPVALTRVRIEGRALSGSLEPDNAILVGSDTTELRVWQPGVQIFGLSSWSNLRNSGDTLRLTLVEGLVLDSLMYGPTSFPLEQCASLASEGSGAAAAGYALEFSAPRWVWSDRNSHSFTIKVRAPEGERYDLTVFDLDGRSLCSLARNAEGSATYPLPSLSCGALDRSGSRSAGRVILHLSPRNAPGIRAVLRITP